MKFVSIICLNLLLLASSCNSANDKTGEPIQSTMLSFLALGDSYTIGEGVDSQMRWPVQLVRELKSDSIIIDSLKIIAKTGWTTANLQVAMDTEVLDDFDMVSLLIGVNNQYQGLEFEQFMLEFDSLLNQAIEIAGSKERVFVVSIPDYGVTPFGANNKEQIAEELDAYNAYMESKAGDFGVPFVNITDISRELGDKEGALAPDRLHPSGEQYTIWLDRVLPVAREILDH